MVQMPHNWEHRHLLLLSFRSHLSLAPTERELQDMQRSATNVIFRPYICRRAIGCALVVAALFAVGCKRSLPVIAVIPRTCGTALWEPEHAGAASVARAAGLEI